MSAAGYAADRTAANCAEVILGYLIEHCGIHDGGKPAAESPEARLFTRIRGLETAGQAVSLVAQELSLARRFTIGQLLDEGVTEAGGYRLEEVTDTVTTADAAKLFLEEPELYEKIAKVPAHVLVRELGHGRLRGMLIEACGAEKVRRFDTISVEDLDAVFSRGEDAARFRKTITFPAGYRVTIQ